MSIQNISTRSSTPWRDEVSTERQRLREAILRSGLKFSESVNPAGQALDWAIDLREVLHRGSALRAASVLLWDRLRGYSPDCIGGMTMSADQLTCGIIQVALGEGRDLAGFSIRRSPKTYGMRRLIEGIRPTQGARVVIVDDLVDTGLTLARTFEILKPHGPNIVAVATVLDFRNPNAAAVLRGRIPLESLFNLEELGIRDLADTDPARLCWLFGPLNVGNYTAPHATPFIDDNGVVAGGDLGFVVALDVDGNEQWRILTNEHEKGVRTVIAPFDGSLVFCAYDGCVYRIDRATGQSIWSRRLADWIGASPVLDPQKRVAYLAVNFHNTSSAFLALDLDDARVVWRRESRDYSYARPALFGQTGVVFAANDGSVQALESETGDLIWQISVPCPVKGWIVADDVRCFFGCFDGNLYALGLADGRELWRRRLADDWLLIQPALNEGGILVSAKDHVCSIACEDGTVRWVTPSQGRVTGIAVEPITGRCVAASDRGVVSCLDLATGSTYWRFRRDASFRTTPGVSSDRCAIPCSDGKLYVFRMR